MSAKLSIIFDIDSDRIYNVKFDKKYITILFQRIYNSIQIYKFYIIVSTKIQLQEKYVLI